MTYTVAEGPHDTNYAEVFRKFSTLEDLMTYLNTYQTKEANLKYISKTAGKTSRKKFDLTPDNIVHELLKDTLYLEQTRQNSVKRWFNINKV